MNCRLYDKAIAEELFGRIIFTEAYVIQDDGVFVAKEFQVFSPPKMAFDWTPTCNLDWPDSSYLLTGQVLPIPFTANQLAACMLDGLGSGIPESINAPIGYPLADNALDVFGSNRFKFVRDALKEAYALAEKAQQQVGEFNHDEWKQAYDRWESWSDGSEFQEKWEAWRKAMVRQLLFPEIQALPTLSQETPAERRKKLDITTERGARRRILEEWGNIEKEYGPNADGTQVHRVLKRDKDESPVAKKTIQNHLSALRKEGLIP